MINHIWPPFESATSLTVLLMLISIPVWPFGCSVPKEGTRTNNADLTAFVRTLVRCRTLVFQEVIACLVWVFVRPVWLCYWFGPFRGIRMAKLKYLNSLFSPLCQAPFTEVFNGQTELFRFLQMVVCRGFRLLDCLRPIGLGSCWVIRHCL